MREDYWFEFRIKKIFSGRRDAQQKREGTRMCARENRTDGSGLEFEQAGGGRRERVSVEFRARLRRGRSEKFKGGGSFGSGP